MKKHTNGTNGKSLCGRRTSNPHGSPCGTCWHLAALAGHHGHIAQYDAQRRNITWMPPRTGIHTYDQEAQRPTPDKSTNS